MKSRRFLLASGVLRFDIDLLINTVSSVLSVHAMRAPMNVSGAFGLSSHDDSAGR